VRRHHNGKPIRLAGDVPELTQGRPKRAVPLPHCEPLITLGDWSSALLLDQLLEALAVPKSD
jgi:hypothetical protein